MNTLVIIGIAAQVVPVVFIIYVGINRMLHHSDKKMV